MIELEIIKEMTLLKENTLLEEVIENMEYMVRVMDSDNNVVYMNKKMRAEFGDFTHKKCYELLGREGLCLECVSAICRKSLKAEVKGVSYGEKFYKVIASPVILNKQDCYAIELFQDITVEHGQEEIIRGQYEKMTGDIEFAKRIQSRALPLNGIYWEALAFDSAYLPSEGLGGDMFDIIKMNEDTLLIYIADISGHGVRSSMLTMFLRQVIRGMRASSINSEDLLNTILKNYNELNLGDEQYFSLLMGLYSIKRREWRIVNAGHNCLPILIKATGGSEEIKVSGMPICSLLKKADHEEKTFVISSGDKLLFYTDGITEAKDQSGGGYFGEERLMDIIEKYAGNRGSIMLNEIVKRVNDFTGGSLSDDAAIFVAEML